MGTKKSKPGGASSVRRIRVAIWNWVRKNFQLVGITSVITAALAWTVFYHDRPNLQVTVRAGPAEYGLGNRNSWSTDHLFKKGLDELVDTGFAYAANDYLQKNQLLVPGGKEVVSKKLRTLGKEIGSTKVRIPIYIRVANNGRRATTIVAGQYTSREWGKVIWVEPIQNIKEHIEPSEVRDFKIRYIIFDGLESLPRELGMDIAFDFFLRKMSTIDPDIKPPVEFLQGVGMMKSKIQPFIKELSGDKELDLTKGFNIEVKLTDQFGEIVSGVTEPIRLRNLDKPQQQ